MSKYFKILIPLLFFCAGVLGQGKPINVYRSAPSVTVNDGYLHAYKGFTLPIVSDTASGVNGSLDSLGQMIYVKSNGRIYQRDSVPTGGHVWTQVGTGAGSSGDSGIVAGVAILVNRIDATHRVVGIDTLHVVASQALAQKKIDSLAIAINSLLAAKVTNFANASFLGYGVYASKPTSGSGFYFVQDSTRLAYITSGVLAWITDPPGKLFHIYIKRKGQPGDSTLLTGTDSTFMVAAIRDSLGWHHVVNPDGSWTCWSTGGGITASDTVNIDFRLDTLGRLASTTNSGQQSTADYIIAHTPIYPENDSVGGPVDSVTYYDNATKHWHFKGLYFRYGHKPTSSLLVNYDDIDTTSLTGLAPRHDLDDTSRVLRQVIATSLINPMSAVGDMIYGGTSGAATRLAGNTTTTKKFYQSTGTGSAATAPTLAALISADIPNNAANTSGTAANLSGTPALPSGTTVTTQTAGTNNGTAASTQYVDQSFSGITFTPTLTNTTNITSSSIANTPSYTKSNNIVRVSVSALVTATAATTARLTISLPINTATSPQGVVGFGFIIDAATTTMIPCYVATSSTSTVDVYWVATLLTSQNLIISFQYKIN